jgi:hypothetical protein
MGFLIFVYLFVGTGFLFFVGKAIYEMLDRKKSE